jgi:hypothetical protein
MNDNTIRVMQLVDENLALRKENRELHAQIRGMQEALDAARTQHQPSTPPGEIPHNDGVAWCMCRPCTNKRLYTREHRVKQAETHDPLKGSSMWCKCETCTNLRTSLYHMDRTWQGNKDTEPR